MHQPVLNHLESFLQGLPNKELESHIAACPDCREQVALMQEHSGLLRALSAPDGPELRRHRGTNRCGGDPLKARPRRAIPVLPVQARARAANIRACSTDPTNQETFGMHESRNDPCRRRRPVVTGRDQDLRARASLQPLRRLGVATLKSARA